ncbi:MAG: hypothetical protein GXY48_05300 [Methanomicrobiales archaeon]|nr:hypothetical protein [Methanomicrobiales archaeon]
MKAQNRTGRIAVWSAIHVLKSQGYLADRCTGTRRTFDLIAWKSTTILALCIRTARKQDITRFHQEISRISTLINQKQVPGTIELWLYHPKGMTRYRIMPGGAMQIQEAA